MVYLRIGVLSATSDLLHNLLSPGRLKQKNVMKVLGRVPNIEKLKRMNIFGLKACFVLITFGPANGFGLAMVKSTAIQMRILDWLIDEKIGLNTEK